MAIREFRDSAGRLWTVWEVTPSLSVSGDRPGRLLHEDAVEGWLAFQSGSERRRFFRTPAGWESLPDPGLEVLCRHATRIDE